MIMDPAPKMVAGMSLAAQSTAAADVLLPRPLFDNNAKRQPEQQHAQRGGDDLAFGSQGGTDSSAPMPHPDDSAFGLCAAPSARTDKLLLLDSPCAASSASGPASASRLLLRQQQHRASRWARWLQSGCFADPRAHESSAFELQHQQQQQQQQRPKQTLPDRCRSWLSQRRLRLSQRRHSSSGASRMTRGSSSDTSELSSSMDACVRVEISADRGGGGAPSSPAKASLLLSPCDLVAAPSVGLSYCSRTSLGARSVASGKSEGEPGWRSAGAAPSSISHLISSACLCLFTQTPSLPPLQPTYTADSQFFDALSCFDAHEPRQQQLLDADMDDMEHLPADHTTPTVAAAPPTPAAPSRGLKPLPSIQSGLALDQLLLEASPSPSPRALTPRAAGPHVPNPPLFMADREFEFVPVPAQVGGWGAGWVRGGVVDVFWVCLLA